MKERAYLHAYASGNGALNLCWRTKDGKPVSRKITLKDAMRFLRSQRAQYLQGWKAMTLHGTVILYRPVKRLNADMLVFDDGVQATYEIDRSKMDWVQNKSVVTPASLKLTYYVPGQGPRTLANENYRARALFFLNHEAELTQAEQPTPTYIFDSAISGGTIRQPFVATCAKCHRTIYFDIDPDGTPGFNGDWGDGHGDYGCEVDNGEDSIDGNGHVPTGICYNRELYPDPTDTKE